MLDRSIPTNNIIGEVVRPGGVVDIVVTTVRTETTIVRMAGFDGRPISDLIDIVKADPPNPRDYATTTVRTETTYVPVYR